MCSICKPAVLAVVPLKCTEAKTESEGGRIRERIIRIAANLGGCYKA